MAAAATSSGCRTTTLFPLSLPKPPSHKLSPVSQQLLFSNKCRPAASLGLGVINIQISSLDSVIRCSVSSPDSTLTEAEAEERGNVAASQSDDEIPLNSGSPRPLAGCKSCGREDIERGCNGEGRIQGGIATFPGFGWWPIKAFRPCPAYLASGARYRRTGQSLDEVISGAGGRYSSEEGWDGAQSGKRKFKS